jgi:ERCC4-type nuclease
VLIDTREKRPWSFSTAVDVETGVTLPTSDYSLAGATDLVALERKSLADLVMSSCSKERERFWDCMRRLSKYKYKALIVEAHAGSVWKRDYRSQATPQSVMATTLALQCDLGIGVIWAGDAGKAAWSAEWMLARIHKRLRTMAP